MRLLALSGCGLAIGVVLLTAVAAGATLASPQLLQPVSAAGTPVRPVSGAVVSQPFGCTAFAAEPVDHACPQGHFHSGIDLAVPAGTPVLASLDGVAHVVLSLTGYGLHVVVDDGGGLSTLYAHLATVLVGDGETVSAGEQLGTVGSTGNSTGPHLHFEVRRDGVPEDPLLDLALP